ncbi:MAG: hypothetical protein GX962_16030 [Epulopiscium sp.]|nr:hypothetical protein [Candidatus Epulonipiscium sp.]
MLKEDPKSNQVVTNTILNEFKKSGYKGFTARPWNFYQAATSLWWLVPSKEWPAYKYGKIAIYREKDKYRIGLHVEKGITKFVADALSIPIKDHEKVVIRDDWKWNGFLRDVKSGKLQKVLNKITDEMNKSLKIIIQLSDYNGPDSKIVEFEGLELGNSITFDFFNSELKCIKEQTKGDMNNYTNINTISELAEVFEDDKNQWYWIDVYILFEVDENEVLDPSEYAFVFIENYKEIFE